METYALLTLAFSMFGDPSIQFLTVPKLYTEQECLIEAPKFSDRFNNPRVGEKSTSNARATCVPLKDADVEELVRGLEQSRKNSDYLYSNHYRTTAYREQGQSTFLIIPNLSLTSREVCERNGAAVVDHMVGVKISSSSVIAEALFNCVRMSPSEANAIIAVVRGSQEAPLDTSKPSATKNAPTPSTRSKK